MTYRANPPAVPAQFKRLFASPRFASSLTLVIIGFAFGATTLRAVIGPPGVVGILVGLVVLAGFSLSARWAGVDWHGLLPISIMVFVGWCAVSVLWSGYPLHTLSASLYQLAFTFLAIYIALARDTIQVVRATGDVLRVLLGLSLALEVLSGLLFDVPFVFLGIQGNIDSFGPVQGIFGSRNVFGLVSLIAAVTFAVELRSRSVRRGLGIGSIALAVFGLLLTRSPVILVVALFVGLAALALIWLRSTPVANRWVLQIALLGATVVAGIIAVAARARIIDQLNAGSEFEARITLWGEIWRLATLHPLEGWGWAGLWPADVTPYGWLSFVTGRPQTSGLNAFLDVYFQVGLVGLLSFLALVLLAFWRSWLLASDKRSIVYVWSPLVLVTLLVTSAAESTVLVDFGWLLLLICAVKAAQGKSWRSLLQATPHRHPE